MPDRGTVIDGMIRHMKDGDCGIDCPYWNLDDCSEQLYKDALALLREKEFVRCKDCKYRFENLRCYANNPMVGRLVGDNWFCADGERR